MSKKITCNYVKHYKNARTKQPLHPKLAFNMFQVTQT